MQQGQRTTDRAGWTLRIGLVLIILLMSIPVMQQGKAQAASVWTVYKEAQKLEARGKYNEAIAQYKQIAPVFVKDKDYGNAAQMYRRIGDCYKGLKHYDEAVANWDLEAEYSGKAKQTQVSIAAKRKANLLRSSAKLYVEQPAGQGTTYGGTKFVPANGALIGAYAELDKAVNDPKKGKYFTEQFPVLTGKKHAAYLLYFNYGSDPALLAKHLERAKASGTALQIGVQPIKGLDQVKDDAYLRGLAKAIGESEAPVFLRFANEMNGGWVKWHGDPKKYIEKFRLVAKVFREEAQDNVAMVWAPGANPTYTIESYYPGDAYVDWVGVSLYTIFDPSLDPLEQGEDRSSHLDKFDHIYQTYAARKPVFISEGGVSYMYPEKRQDKTKWAVYKLREFYSSLPMVYPKVKGVFWFDSNGDSTARIKYYMLSANEQLLKAYKESVAHPFYLGSIGEKAPVSYKPVNNSTIQAGKLKLSGYVKTWAPTLSKVSYQIGGRTVGTASAPPWTAEIDFRAYKGKKLEIAVQAYDNSGKLVTTQKVNVKLQ
ncbi:glycosyl hydrolase [Paenibacillus sambharensis]|nr:glycosyl hydrolase [Paenibacillus sambharensis]